MLAKDGNDAVTDAKGVDVLCGGTGDGLLLRRTGSGHQHRFQGCRGDTTDGTWGDWRDHYQRGGPGRMAAWQHTTQANAGITRSWIS